MKKPPTPPIQMLMKDANAMLQWAQSYIDKMSLIKTTSATLLGNYCFTTWRPGSSPTTGNWKQVSINDYKSIAHTIAQILTMQ